MKILFYCNSLRYFMDHRINLVLPLIDAGHDVALVSGECTDDVIARVPSALRLVPLDFDRHRLQPGRDFAAVRRFLAEVRDWQPDVVHAITIKPNLFSVLSLPWLRLGGRRLPRLVMTFPGLGRVFEETGLLAWLRRFLFIRAMRLGLHFLDYAATFENPADRDWLVSLGIIGKDRAQAIMGAGIDRVEFAEREQAQTGPLSVLLASRLLHGKGIGDYCDAANALAAEGAKTRFLLAGPADPGYPDNFDVEQARRSGQLGVVEYLGPVPGNRMADLFRSVDIACLPSRLREGFPRSLIEAAACGCALIGTDQPSVRQIVEPGHTGWLVPAGDPVALAAVLRDAAADPVRARALGAAAARLARESGLGNDDIFSKFAALYGVKVPVGTCQPAA